MRPLFHPYDVTQEADVRQPLDYNVRSRLKHSDQVFKARITNVVSLTEQEKLFHLYILDKAERRIAELTQDTDGEPRIAEADE